MQFRLAEKSAAMAIFLGKNILGQSDYPENDDEEVAKRANEQIQSLADLINNPVPNLEIEDVLNGDEGTSEETERGAGE